MQSIWAHEIQLSYFQKKNEKSDKRNFKEKKEKKRKDTSLRKIMS